MELDEFRAAYQRGERGVEVMIDYVVALGGITIDPTPDARVIFSKLAKVVSNLSILNAIQAQIQMKLSKTKGLLALESARYKVEYDQALLSNPEVKSAPSEGSRELIARGICAPTADKVAQLKNEYALIEGVNKVVSTTHKNLVTMKEALSKQVSILELELAASVGTRPGMK